MRTLRGQLGRPQIGKLVLGAAFLIADIAIARSPSTQTELETITVEARRHRARPQALSSWDLAYLKALYRTDSGAVTQRAAITLTMSRDLTP